jgi:formaldehyde-activating enzyme involved in methanogenesis
LTTRIIQAAQAAIAAAVIASIAAVLALHATDKADDLFVIPWAVGATLVLTFAI